MIKEALQYLVGLASPHLERIGEVDYTDKVLRPILPLDYRPDCMLVHTLSGLIDYVRSIEGDLPDEKGRRIFIHVETHSKVHLYSEYSGITKKRTHYIESNLQDFQGFRFGQWQPHEQFVINLQTLFVPNEGITRLFSTIGKMKYETGIESDDDGITQSVASSKGVHLKDVIKVENPFILQPFRTFPEVEQPESSFILRVRGKEGQVPECALFEADGLTWKMTAIRIIRDYLKKELPEVPVAA